MIDLKSEEEIKKMEEGGKRLRAIVDELIKIVKPGITTWEIEEIAERLIKKSGGYPAFKKVKNYFWSVCTPVNEEIVHTPPKKEVRLKEGDLLTVDIGLLYQGYNTDYAETMIVGKDVNHLSDFLEAGKRALKKAIEVALVGNYVGDISFAIEKEIKASGYTVIRDLVGHGIGKELHEDPFIPGFFEGERDKTPRLVEGMTLAIEVIYSQGSDQIKYKKNDGWTIVTADGSLAACFETTVAILEKKTLILV